MNEEYILFTETAIHKTYPRYVNMQKESNTGLATNHALEGGPDSVRDYWNGKNLRKRKT